MSQQIFVLLMLTLLPVKLFAMDMGMQMSMPVDYYKTNSTWEYTAVASGNWSDAQTWQQQQVPTADANVFIPAGKEVSVNQVMDIAYSRVFVEGTLTFDPTQNTRLIFDSLFIDYRGILSVVNNNENTTTELIVASNRNAPLDIAQKTRGILNMGTLAIDGSYKQSKAVLAGDALARENTLTFKSLPASWRIGDEIVVTSTHFSWDRNVPLQNEVKKIQNISGNTLTLNSALVYDHKRASPEFEIYVSNLTRNIVFRSAKESPLTERGHIMSMHGTTVNFNSAAVVGFGRTDKVNDVSSTNPAGVYPIHFHRNGYDNQQRVTNTVVRGTPGWGIVNHSSNVMADDNVVHDFAGVAFSSEAGDEIGVFSNNIATGGTNRTAFNFKGFTREILGRFAQLWAQGDAGKFATGFWLVSPQVEVVRNVVAGSRGTAYLYFAGGTMENGQLTGFPLSLVPAGINPRLISHVNQFTGEQMVSTQDLPIKRFDQNIAYGTFQGFRARWMGNGTTFIFNRLVNLPAPFETSDVNYQISTVSNSLFWNVASGINIGYSKNFRFENIVIENAQDFDRFDMSCPDRSDIDICSLEAFSVDSGAGDDSQLINFRTRNFQYGVDLAAGKKKSPISNQTVINSLMEGKSIASSHENIPGALNLPPYPTPANIPLFVTPVGDSGCSATGLSYFVAKFHFNTKCSGYELVECVPAQTGKGKVCASYDL